MLDRIGLASYIYSLDGQTTYNYLPFATSAYDRHSLISTIQVAQSVISQSPPPLPSLRRPLSRSAMPQSHQFQSKPSDVVRRRLSSVVSSKRPNVQAYSSLTVRRYHLPITTHTSSSISYPDPASPCGPVLPAP